MSQHEVSTRETGNGNGRLRSSNGGCELLFGDGTVEHTLDSWPCVSLLASGWLSVSRMRLLMNFLACGPGGPVWSPV